MTSRLRPFLLGVGISIGIGRRRGLSSASNVCRFIREYRRYNALARACGLPEAQWSAISPILSDFSAEAGSASGDYFHADLWAARKIFLAQPTRHVDIGSRIDGFVAHLLTFRSVEVIDVRVLTAPVDGLAFLQDDASALVGIGDQSLPSISSLHAIEHFGLGRYGDPLAPDGHLRALRSMQRVLAPGGDLYLAVPSGRPRTHFNAQRIVDPLEVVTTLSELVLVDFGAVASSGALDVDADPGEVSRRDYACSLFHFRRPVE